MYIEIWYGNHVGEAESATSSAEKKPRTSAKPASNRKASFRRPGKPHGVLKSHSKRAKAANPEKHPNKKGEDKDVAVDDRASCVSGDNIYKGTYDISCLSKESYPSAGKANGGLHSYTLTSAAGAACIEVLLKHSAYSVKRVAWTV